VKWQDPPLPDYQGGDGKHKFNFESVAPKLLANPGRWALVWTYHTEGGARVGSQKLRRLWMPKGYVFANRHCDLYAKYVGERS
jgi:hypothetical protein